MERYHLTEKIIKCEICNIAFKPDFEKQAMKWRDILENKFKKCFKRIRITNKTKGKSEEINLLMEKRRKLRRK